MTFFGRVIKPLFKVTKSDIPPFPDGENDTTRRLEQVVDTP